MIVTPQTLVERFYRELWNEADEAIAAEILHPEFRFRSSLGSERQGPAAFCDYMRAIHQALAHCTCTIDALVADASHAAARMRFSGTHRAPFFGVAATGRTITWAGAAFFATNGCQITELWVLGDIDAVKQQLGAAAGSTF